MVPVRSQGSLDFGWTNFVTPISLAVAGRRKEGEPMDSPAFQYTATIAFALAILHTFSVGVFKKWSRRFPEDSIQGDFLHLISEVEVVFGLWASIFFLALIALFGTSGPIAYLESLNFTEPIFIFVILVVCGSQPILKFAQIMIDRGASLLPLKPGFAFYIVLMSLGPLLGSFITEPAAMTVIALLLLDRYFMNAALPTKFKYATVGLLFVNVSIGGTLTSFAAPPVLMVAERWHWDLPFMLRNFGYKGALACLVSTLVLAYRFRVELCSITFEKSRTQEARPSKFVTFAHLAIVGLIVAAAHHPVVVLGLFLIFLGLISVTRRFQEALLLREGLLVAFFLSGLIVLGGPQRWWIEPVIQKLSAFGLFLGATVLTAILDNAAITYLGAQVPDLNALSQYALVAGAVVGGGLTVIANAPNPAGYGLLSDAVEENGIRAWPLFQAALLPTVIAAACFWFLP